MDFRIALLLARWPAGQANNSETADYWRQYFGDSQMNGMSNWWWGQTDGNIHLTIQKLVDWIDIQVPLSLLQSKDGNGNLTNTFGRNNVAGAIFQTSHGFPRSYQSMVGI